MHARIHVLFLFVLLCSAGVGLGDTSPSLILDDGNASVRFDPSQEAAAKEVLRLYPTVRSDLERLIAWPIEFNPTFVLLKEGQLEKMAGTDLVAALAVPERNLVLFDLSKMARHAFVLEATMKHEICHLLLHYYIRENKLPKWLDEGICQWVSDGVAEIIMDRKGSFFGEAVLAEKIMPFQQLNEHFPGEDRSLILAYEQSKSIVTYLSQKYGTDKLLSILNRLHDGTSLQDAVKQSLGITVSELEHNWRGSIKKGHTWLVYISIHLYEILFFAAALLTLGGFVRLMRRRKKLGEEEADDES